MFLKQQQRRHEKAQSQISEIKHMTDKVEGKRSDCKAALQWLSKSRNT